VALGTHQHRRSRRGWVAALAGAVVLMWSCALIAGWCAPPQWTAPIRLSTPTGPVGVAAIDASGNGESLVVAWSDTRLGQPSVFVRVSLDAGATWQDERLVPSSGPASHPSVLAYDGGVYIAYVQEQAQRSSLYVVGMTRDGWLAPVQVAAAPAISAPRLAATSAYPVRLAVVFDNAFGGITTAQWSRSDDLGRTWTTPAPIAPDSPSTGKPSIAGGPDTFHVAWRDRREGVAHVVYSQGVVEFQTRERRLSDVAGSGEPSISAMGRRVAVAWQSQPSREGPNIYSTVSDDGGATWSVPWAITQSTAQSTRPSVLAMREGDVTAWQDGSSGDWEVHVARREGGAWGSPDRLTESAVPSILPRLALTDDPSSPVVGAALAHAVWIDRSTDGSAAVFCSTRDAWPPATPGRPVHSDSSAREGWDDDSTALFRWDPVPGAAVYRVFAAVDGGAREPVAETQLPEHRLPVLDGTTVRVAVSATDAVGNEGPISPESSPIDIDLSAPTVVLDEPRDGTVAFLPVPVRVACRDANLEAAYVEYGSTLSPSEWHALAGPFVDSFDLREVAVWDVGRLMGAHRLRVRAVDHAGNETTVSVRVDIDRRPAPAVGPGSVRALLPSSELSTGRRDPSWSPDGSRIAFASDEGGSSDLWWARIDGTESGRLTRDMALDAHPDWSPDGSRIVYTSQRDGVWQLHVVDVARLGVTSLTTGVSAAEDPAWSPDGKNVAFASNEGGDYELFVLTNVDAVLRGGTPSIVQITRNGADDRDPAWSPDGRFLSFQSHRAGSWDIWRVRVDTGSEEPLLTGPYHDLRPAFAQSGKQLLFTREGVGAPAHARVLDLVSGGEMRTTREGLVAANACWAPDARHIAVESDGEIMVLDLMYAETPLEARIESPVEGAFVSGTVRITGAARGSDFVRYRLESKQETEGTAWAIVEGPATSPVEPGGFLGAWDTRGLRGPQRLRLVVESSGGQTAVAEVKALARPAKPEIFVASPLDGLVTLASSVRVSGVSTARLVTVNGERIATSSKGEFSADIGVPPGNTVLRVVAEDATGESSELRRTVRRVVESMSLVVDSPLPFEKSPAPYVVVAGRADEGSSVRVDGVPVPLVGGKFSRVVRIPQMGGIVTVVAQDALGREAAVVRQVQVADVGASGLDAISPAVTNPMPPFGARYTDPRSEFRCQIVDDRAMDADSLSVSMDGDEIDEENWTFDSESGALRIQMPVPPGDGTHRIVIAGADVAGNALRFGEWNVTLDRQPLSVQLSAEPTNADGSSVRATLTSNVPLRTVRAAQAAVPGQAIGYPLAIPVPADTAANATGAYVYTAELAIAYGSIVGLSAEVVDVLGRAARVRGECASVALLRSAPTVVELSNGVRAELSPTQQALPRRIVVRSQDGRDQTTIRAQREDAEARGLSMDSAGGGAYLFADGDAATEPTATTWVAPRDVTAKRAWFTWDETSQRWQPLPNSQTGPEVAASGAPNGVVALLSDADRPVLTTVEPPSGSAISGSRYYVDAEATDVGSGIDPRDVVAYLDGSPVSVRVTPVNLQTVHVRYVPVDVGRGLHTLRLVVRDRAGNSEETELDYITQAVFDFTDVRLVPNPARTSGKALFQLTGTADVAMDIYAPDGTRVYHAEQSGVSGSLDPARSTESLTWDLANSNGKPVASGVYVVRLTATSHMGGKAVRYLKWAVVR